MPLFRRRTPPAPITLQITYHREDPFGQQGRRYVYYRGFTIEQNCNHCCVRAANDQLVRTEGHIISFHDHRA